MLVENSRLTIPKATLTTLAGNAAGKRVLCRNAEVLNTYNKVAELARSGNHWARISINGIQGLSSSRLGKTNVFVKQTNTLDNGRGVFFMILPGIRATFEDLANGTIELVKLEYDWNYADLQKGHKKPALYKVSDNGESVVLKPDCLITPRDGRPVIISDTTPKKPNVVAQFALTLIDQRSAQTANHAQAYGFDLHYTPGKKGITGLRSVNSMLNSDKREIAESASMLANAMHQARDLNGVEWISSFGGSAILTQALQILKNHGNVRLKNHSIFLHHPTSNSKLALKLAEDLKMSFNDKKTGLSLREIRGNHIPSFSPKGKMANIADKSLDTLSATSSLVAPIATVLGVSAGVLGSPVIGIAAGGLFFVKAALSIKKKIVKTNYK